MKKEKGVFMIPLWIVWIIIIILAAICVVVVVSSYENKRLVVEHYKITSKKIPDAFDDFRIVFLTDLHCNEFGAGNQQLLEKIHQCRPDVVLAGGDMVTSREDVPVDVPLKLMKDLAEEYMVYYADGNHELRLMRNEEIFGLRYKEYIHQLKEFGVHHMSNETIVMEAEGEEISLTAFDLEKKFYDRFQIPEMTYEDMLEDVGEKPERSFNILLAHNPNYFKTYAQWGSDLVLAGHFHGGMIRIPKLGGVISPQFQLFPKYDSGEFHIGDSTMVLSRGLGNHSIKLRLFNQPEISCITLKKQRNEHGN